MGGHRILVPETENPPAKVKDEGIINLVKAGRAAYNARSGELLLLPEGASQLRHVMNGMAGNLQSNGFQRVNCSSDDAIFSLAERYVREWGEDAAAYCEGRGRDIRIIGWNPDEASAAAACDRAKSSLLESLNGEANGIADFSFVEDVTENDGRTFVLVTGCNAGDAGAREGFICPSCGDVKFPDSPLDFAPSQPGADEPEEDTADIETPGANTITELCSQLGIDVKRTLKAMLYIARRESEPTCVAAFVRGDYNISMNKLSKWLERERGLTGLRTAEKAELRGLAGEIAGYCGPVGMPPNVAVVADISVKGSRNTVVGANRPGYHKKGCCHPRDFDPPIVDIAQLTAGNPCRCGDRYAQQTLRELGVILVSNVSGGIDANENLKVLSYNDRDGRHEFPWICRGTIYAERILIAMERTNSKQKRVKSHDANI